MSRTVFWIIFLKSLNVKLLTQAYVITAINRFLPWNEANEFCQDIGSNLASIHSSYEFILAQEVCTGSDCWIGLTDIDSEGVWTWDDGSITDYGFVNNNNTKPTTGTNPWGYYEPNNYAGNEDCTHLGWSDGLWNDAACTNGYLPICQNVTESSYKTKSPTSNHTYSFSYNCQFLLHGC